MRRITTWALSTVSALVLLFSYHTSVNAAGTTSIVAAGGSVADGANGAGGTGGAGSTTTTVTGDAISTRFGPVQVEITVADGTITKSVVTQVPWTDHRDQEINSYAVPILNDEAVSTQSAGIDMVSGATYTSDGYIGSLQSAIDRANL